MLLISPVAHIAPVDAYCKGDPRRGQQLPITGGTLDKSRLLLTQLRFQSLGYLERIIAHRFDVQVQIKRQKVLEGIKTSPVGHQGGPLGFHIHTTWRVIPTKEEKKAAWF